MTINRLDTSSSDAIKDRRRQMSACRRKYSGVGIAGRLHNGSLPGPYAGHQTWRNGPIRVCIKLLTPQSVGAVMHRSRRGIAAEFSLAYPARPVNPSFTLA